MGLFQGLTADGRLAKRHDKMEKTGNRPPYLSECYMILRHLEKEANRLHGMGYRIQSRQTDGQRGYHYVTFAYDQHETVLPR
jgi:hypothetical protein